MGTAHAPDHPPNATGETQPEAINSPRGEIELERARDALDALALGWSHVAWKKMSAKELAIEFCRTLLLALTEIDPPDAHGRDSLN